jgi:hypothetical protein
MLVKSLKLHPYGGKYHAKGSEYEMTKRSDIKLMVAIKCVEPVEAKKEVNENSVVKPIVTPSFTKQVRPVENEFKYETRGRKRKEGSEYDRKDMRANSDYRR